VCHDEVGAVNNIGIAQVNMGTQRVLGMVEDSGNEFLGVHIRAFVVKNGHHLVEELAELLAADVDEVLLGHNRLEVLRDALGNAIRIATLKDGY